MIKKCVVVVESPAKAQAVKDYLKGYQKNHAFEVLASYGHVRDLPAKKGSVNPEQQFAMTYQPIERNLKHLDKIASSLKNSHALYLATDPDREGEAISWHILQAMEERQLLQNKTSHRIFFNQITKAAIREAMDNPRDIAMDLVNAQQARRALDYLVGFNLSPLLWKKIRRGLSAGRVQSPALRLIVERELEIEAFKPREYWKITAVIEKDAHEFQAKLTRLHDQKIEQFTITNQEQATQIQSELLAVSNQQLVVKEIEKKLRKRQPAPPFITSTLQQEASRKLGFTTRKTMSVAQQLYEGINLGDGVQGLITYMRTDSVSLSKEGIQQLRELISERFGNENLPKTPRVFKTKSKNAQEAHEAIRPTNPMLQPSDIKRHLSAEQHKLYELIWKRTVASQMLHASIDTVAIDMTCGNAGIFRANGSSIRFPGFMRVYLESKDDKSSDDNDDNLLPPLEVNEVVPLNAINPSQHFTEPPPRYSEASLVKALEEFGIGRPSTYAAIIQILQHREYVYLEKKRFYPTDVGRVVNRFLTQYFNQYVDYDFTAQLEDQLDAVARGEKQWIPLLSEFWQPFTQQIEAIDQQVQRKDVTSEDISEKCPECGGTLSIRLGKRGRFIGCNAFPECNYTSSLEGEDNRPTVVEGRSCPQCSSDLVIRPGRYGKFIGCSSYPQCKFIEPIEKPSDTGITCPKCNEGKLLQRKSRKGKVFFSCGRYPKCDYALWNAPIAKPCPNCQWPILTLKETKTSGKQWLCPQKECGYITQAES